MSVPIRSQPGRAGRLAGVLVVAGALLAGGSVVAGCSPTGHPAASTTATPAPPATEAAEPTEAGAAAPGGGTMTAGGHLMPTETEIAKSWAGRPEFVQAAHPMVQEAYAYALERPDVIEWLPCYCGCAAMDHRSNLDCFFKRRGPGEGIAFEEHASYCDICVQTALTAEQMMAKGRSLSEVRATVDAMYRANGVPGTPTELPPG